MLIVGLTGSIGMGKSTAAARFRHNGIAVFDADAEVHRLYESSLAPKIEAAFPGSTVDGKVDRARLSSLLLADDRRFKALEAIVHPAVRAQERLFLHAEYIRGAEIAVLEIPLLLEARGENSVDSLVVVSAPKEVQRARVLARPGMSEDKFEAIVARQLSDDKKRARADFVVDTGGSVESCNSQIDAIVAKLRTRSGNAFDKIWRG